MPLPGVTSNGDSTSSGGPPHDSRDISPIRSLDDIALAGADLLNNGGVAEGQQTPPAQHGTYRVPAPTGFHVVSQTYNPATLSSIFVLAWNDVTDSADGLNQAQVAQYKVYAQLAISDNPQPVVVGESEASPCYATVLSPTSASQVVFTLRPYLTNGQTLPLETCPTCTGSTPTPFYEFTSGNVSVIIDSNRPIGGGTSAGLGVINNSTGRQATYAAGFLVGFKDASATDRMWSLGFGGSGQGLLFLYDGTGSGGILGAGERVELDGGQGHILVLGPGGGNPGLIQLGDSSGTTVILQSSVDGVAPTGGTQYLNIIINGVPYKITVQAS